MVIFEEPASPTPLYYKKLKSILILAFPEYKNPSLHVGRMLFAKY